MAFSPDEQQLFVTEKEGSLRLIDIGASAALTLRSTPVIDLTAQICAGGSDERGLLGVALDPNFTANRYFYLFYTYNRANSCATNSASSPVNRVSRFTLATDGTANLGSERVLVDNMPSPNGNHNGGDIHFGADGYLYIAIGDGGRDYAGGGSGGGNDAARDRNVLTGKILRIIANPDLPPEQRIPASNPYATTGTICAVDGRGPQGTPISTDCQETFAIGLRNPFRLAFDPNTTGTSTTFYINDVGQGIWEEIDLGEAGADYRWNICEGSYTNGTRTLCTAPQGAERNPIHEYDHSDATNDPSRVNTSGCSSITDGVVVPAGAWPGYDGDYLFADFVCGKIFQIDPASPTNRALFASGLGGIADMSFGPASDGSRALYYASIFTGEISRIALTAQGNRAPSAALSADPLFGSRTVSFDGTGSSEPDSEALTYMWSFGNGVTLETSTPTTSYTYPSDGQYLATLQVRDPSGLRSRPAVALINTAGTPPTPRLWLPLVAIP
jgi:glucose/arabinose dehydrogenase